MRFKTSSAKVPNQEIWEEGVQRKEEGSMIVKLKDVLLKFWRTGNRWLGGKSLVEFVIGRRSRLNQNDHLNVTLKKEQLARKEKWTNNRTLCEPEVEVLQRRCALKREMSRWKFYFYLRKISSLEKNSIFH